MSKKIILSVFLGLLVLLILALVSSIDSRTLAISSPANFGRVHADEFLNLDATVPGEGIANASWFAHRGTTITAIANNTGTNSTDNTTVRLPASIPHGLINITLNATNWTAAANGDGADNNPAFNASYTNRTFFIFVIRNLDTNGINISRPTNGDNITGIFNFSPDSRYQVLYSS